MLNLVFNPLIQKVLGALSIVAMVLLAFSLYKCEQKAKDKARIEHNNQKKDAFIVKEKARVEVYEQKEKAKLLEAKRLITIDNLLVDKSCVNDFLLNCKDEKEACKKDASKACHRPKKKFTPEELRKIREKHFLELEGAL